MPRKVVESSKMSPKSKPRKTRRRKAIKRKESDGGNSHLLQQLNARYGKAKKRNDEISTAFVSPTTHPSSYVRLMSRAVESHMNRLTQPEQPADLIQTVWLCALCQNRSCFDALGDLYGPHYAKINVDSHKLPKFLIPIAKSELTSSIFGSPVTKLKTGQSAQSSPSTKKRAKHEVVELNSIAESSSQKVGFADLWLHGQCAFWSPELFLIGGQFPGLLDFLNKYWQQRCLVCSKVGASIELKGKKTYIHYPCAVEKGYRLNELTLTCLPPKI